MTRALTRDQIGVGEEMIATFGDLVFELSHNRQRRLGDPIRRLDYAEIDSGQSVAVGLRFAEIEFESASGQEALDQRGRLSHNQAGVLPDNLLADDPPEFRQVVHRKEFSLDRLEGFSKPFNQIGLVEFCSEGFTFRGRFRLPPGGDSPLLRDGIPERFED